MERVGLMLTLLKKSQRHSVVFIMVRGQRQILPGIVLQIRKCLTILVLKRRVLLLCDNFNSYRVVKFLNFKYRN